MRYLLVVVMLMFLTGCVISAQPVRRDAAITLQGQSIQMFSQSGEAAK